MSAPTDLPEIVTRAFNATRKAGYASFCRNETGRLLAMLAATRQGVLAELGTGTGVGTAWLRSGIVDHGSRIISAELNETLASTASEIFAEDDRVDVVAADWSHLTDLAPFSLLFLDASLGVDVDQIADLMEHEGIVVIDDLQPSESWPPTVYGIVDPVREAWLSDDRFTAAEVMVAPDAAALIATRR